MIPKNTTTDVTNIFWRRSRNLPQKGGHKACTVRNADTDHDGKYRSQRKETGKVVHHGGYHVADAVRRQQADCRYGFRSDLPLALSR